MFAAVSVAAASRQAPRAVSSGELSLLQAMNEARAANGAPPLELDSSLRRAARAHSRDMLAHRYFAHGAFARRMTGYHVRGPFIGENLAWGVGSLAAARAIVDQWLASPEHRANLLRPGFRRVGVGAVTGTFNGYAGASIVTADFAGR